jgi:hypothetical protein
MINVNCILLSVKQLGRISYCFYKGSLMMKRLQCKDEAFTFVFDRPCYNLTNRLVI